MGQSRIILAVPAALQRVGDRLARCDGTIRIRNAPCWAGSNLGTDVEGGIWGLKVGEPVVVEGAFLLKAEAEKRAGGGNADGHPDDPTTGTPMFGCFQTAGIHDSG